MNKKLLWLGAGSLALAAIIIIPTVSQAYRGSTSVKGPNYSPERHAAIQKAFDNNDYEAWKKEMGGRGKASLVINKDNFPKFKEMHQLTLAGKTVEAQKLRDELGLGAKNGKGKGDCNGEGKKSNK